MSHAGHVGLLALIFVFGASTAILHFERLPESNIRTAGDAIWWAVATITTVGYGDRYPVTAEGRVVTATLMVPASACSHSPRRAAALRDEIASLRKSIESRVVT